MKAKQIYLSPKTDIYRYVSSSVLTTISGGEDGPLGTSPEELTDPSDIV